MVTVADNSHSAKPLLYKFTGTWGNHEGSMLLWIWILAVYGAAVAVFGRNLPPAFRSWVLAVQALIGLGFLVFVLATSNPFLRLDPAPFDGRDLNPLLQDPGLAFHPPLLYLGYVGLSTAFSFAVAALIEGRVNAAWARWVRPWTLLSWCALTAGIALGSWWAYYELGWGGYWFWDPVENASFMPWLMATALLHSSIVAEKRDSLKSWTVLLAILGFSLSLLGTFLVRSGVLTSVHSFASDPARGVYILVFLVIVVGGSLTLYAWRAPGMRAGGSFRPLSREGSLLANNLLLAVGCATVFIGTLYPLVLDAIADQKVSVGPPFFESTFVPLMIPLLLMMAAGPLMAWKRAGAGVVLPRLAISLAAAVAVAAGVGASGGGPWGAVLGMALAGWVGAGVLTELAERVRLFRVPLAESARRAVGLPRAAWATTTAHLGVAVLVVGTVGAGNWQSEREQVMQPGESLALAGYNFELQSIGGRARPQLYGSARRGSGAAGQRGGCAAPARAPPLSGAGHLDHGGRDSHDLALRPLCRGRRGCAQRRHGDPYPSQPTRPLDLDRRTRHGGGRCRLADRPPPPGWRARATAALGTGCRCCRRGRLRSMTDESTQAPVEEQAEEKPVSAFRRLRYLAPVFLFVALAAALAVQLLTGEPSKVPSALIDKPVPEFSLPPVQGFEKAGGFATADLGNGEIALVNIFASWCGPCRVEHPLLMALAEAGTVPLYGINYKDTPDDAERWLGRLGNPYTLMGADLNGRTGIEWGVYGVPETFVVDGSGRIRHRHVGVLSKYDLDETILPLIEDLRG